MIGSASAGCTPIRANQSPVDCGRVDAAQNRALPVAQRRWHCALRLGAPTISGLLQQRQRRIAPRAYRPPADAQHQVAVLSPAAAAIRSRVGLPHHGAQIGRSDQMMTQ